MQINTFYFELNTWYTLIFIDVYWEKSFGCINKKYKQNDCTNQNYRNGISDYLD